MPLPFELVGERTIREWAPVQRLPPGFTIGPVVIGRDSSQLGIEVVVLEASATAKTTREAMAKYHAARVNDRIASVVIVAVRDDFAWILPPNAHAAVVGPLPTDQTARMLQTALDEPTGIAARQRLAQMLATWEGIAPQNVEEQLVGISNSGLFASHELRTGVRKRSDWAAACEKARPLLRLRREELIEHLGYSQQPLAAHALVLSTGGVKSRAIALLLDETESFEGGSVRFSVSPVNYAIALANKHDLPWVMILRGSQLRLYPARIELGVGRNSPATTYFEIDLSVVRDDDAGFLTLICAAEALAEGGTTSQILATSSQYAVALGSRLRTQVYERIVPFLSVAVAKQYAELGHALDREGLDLAYRLTLRVFFRLLFQAYAEDHKLLPYGENERYDRNALNTLARDLVDHPNEEHDPESASLWDDLAQVWRVIDKGDRNWSVPAYNGGLFDVDPELQPEGALLDRMRITNDVMGPVLRAMLIDEADGLVGPIDFRSLSVREFGTIYEGLLESNLAIADTDLMRDAEDTWVPAPDGVEVDPLRSAPAGTVYFHTTSGQRKGTGSYFTPSFAVQHLLERALDPALAEHLDRVKDLLDKDDQVGAADLFFDFRVADLAMGSGHFLTAAIDHIEQGMGAFLVDNPIPGVENELRHLETAAREAAGPDAPKIEPMLLLRRQIARRCIYGLDINPIAVELARVSIWIHTFVRGLPMSSLDHNLVCANSLTGIGTVDEALDVLVPGRKGQATIFDAAIEDALDKARDMLVDVANAAEATRKESKDAARAAVKARKEAEQAKLLFDAAVLRRIGEGHAVNSVNPDEIAQQSAYPMAQELLAPLKAAHMPVLFPEVFLREKGGFDVLVGNPPWDKIRYEPTQFWVQKSPGLLSSPDRDAVIERLRIEHPDYAAEEQVEIAAREQLRAALISAYALQGTGHHDLSKFFAERNIRTVAIAGTVGIVLPGAFCSLGGWEKLRRAFMDHGDMTVTQAENTGGFLFPNVHFQTTVAFVISRGDQSPSIRVNPGANSIEDFSCKKESDASLDIGSLVDLDGDAQIPWLRSRESASVFERIVKSPSLGSGESWIQGSADTRWDFSASGRGAGFATAEDAVGSWKVLMTRHVDAYRIDFDGIRKFIPAESLNQLASAGKLAMNETDDYVLPRDHPRIAYRFPSSSTNSRTLVAAWLPNRGALYSTGYAHGVDTHGATEEDTLALLSIMNSIPADWWSRRVVDRHVGTRIIRNLPVPTCSSAVRQRLAVLAQLLIEGGDLAEQESTGLALAEIDALVAHGYGLSRADVVHLFETFHRGWDFGPRLAAVLVHFDGLEASS